MNNSEHNTNPDNVTGNAADIGNIESPPVEVVYNTKSELRSPVKLVGDIGRELYRGRELAWRLFQRNIKGLYRQTLFGFFWAVLPPVANTAMWIFLRSANIFSLEGTGVDATVYILTGMILWQAFIDAFNMPMTSLQRNSNMIRKLSFPRESLILVGFGEVLFNLGIRLLLLIPTFIWFQVPLQSGMLLAPLAILALVFFGASLGMLLMPIDSLYKDVGRFVKMILPFWMIVTPIIYVPFTEGWATLLNWVNPAAPLLILARDWMLVGVDSPHLPIGLIFALVSVPLFLFGMILYRVALPVLTERMAA